MAYGRWTDMTGDAAAEDHANYRRRTDLTLHDGGFRILREVGGSYFDLTNSYTK